MADLRQFRQFVAVAEELSFRRAAERLNMAQPPLTVAIRRLEEAVGTTLIERGNRVTRLTEAGQDFLHEARRTLSQAERAMQVAKRAGAGLTGLLRITFAPTVSRDVLPSLLREFRLLHPQVRLELVEAMTTQQLAALREDRADIGFVVPPLHEAEDLTSRVIARSRLVAALPHDHRLARGRKVVLADLAGDSWIQFPGRHAPGLHQRIHAACSQAGFVPRVAQEAMQMETIASLVAAGLGVAMVSDVVAQSRRHGVVFRELSGPGTPVEYELALVHTVPTPTINSFTRIALARGGALND